MTGERRSVIATTDGTGAAPDCIHGPYGEPLPGWTGSSFRYTGQIAIPEAKLYHYKARAHDPGIGRFLQTDPIGTKDAVNLYAYVGNDLINHSDPSGNCPECIGALVGVGIEGLAQTVEIAAGARDHFDKGSLVIVGVAGATGIGAARLIGRVGEIGRLAKFTLNRLADGAISAGTQVAKDGEVSPGKLAIDAGVGGLLGDVVGAQAAKLAGSSEAAQEPGRTANRLERVAGQSTRTVRQEAASEARVKASAFVENAEARAGQSATQVATRAAACTSGESCH